MNYQAIKVRFQESICFLTIDREHAGNAIDSQLVLECEHVMGVCEENATVIVLAGSADVFSVGADFAAVLENGESSQRKTDARRMYDVWLAMATGPYVCVSVVKGKANAGALGFVAASDIVLAGESAVFSLSEMLFGLYPACVLPFLARRIGLQRANYMALMTQPFNVHQALSWGLVDAVAPDVDALLHRHLLRLRRLSKQGIRRYKKYLSEMNPGLHDTRALAVDSNVELFSNPENLNLIRRYVEHGVFPWEAHG